jgi:hypothetical protein
MLYVGLGTVLSFTYLFSISTSCRRKARLIGSVLLSLVHFRHSGIREATGQIVTLYVSSITPTTVLKTIAYKHFEPRFNLSRRSSMPRPAYSWWMFVRAFTLCSRSIFASI